MEWERLHFDELKPNPGRFEEGSPALLATAALLESVGVIEGVGFDAVHHRVLAIADYTRRALRAKGHDRRLARRTASSAVRYRRLSAPDGKQSGRAGTLRRGGRPGPPSAAATSASPPHAYISESDIDRAVEVL